ncbi:ABC transporter substrate-binding protein [Uliginosibacterium sp. sgz301328]|uniref:ABC transporter substrate-binding protein n=1 Tax=Uliginosibacterium sp. sgz301328 TaxID=3243764 RepID=UPI00359CFC3F
MQRSTWRHKALACVVVALSAASSRAELVIGTTFSPSATAHLISVWAAQDGKTVRTVNRTSGALLRAMQQPEAEGIDLILSSSPVLFQQMTAAGVLASNPIPRVAQSERLLPAFLRETTSVVALSGYGVLSHRERLRQAGVSLPATWDALADRRLRGLVVMSTPSRSDTNLLMVETILQQRGWAKGWALLMGIGGNLSTISSRSFGVSHYIETGVGAAGPVIDNYANVLIPAKPLAFRYFQNFTSAPTYIAISAASRNKAEAERFIAFLLSQKGQEAFADAATGKYPVTLLPAGHPLAAQQKRLLAQPTLDYGVLFARQRLVQELFDRAITDRLMQLQDDWRQLDAAEARTGRVLSDVRALLTAVPVTSAQATDPKYVGRFAEEHGAGARESEVVRWLEFFERQHKAAIAIMSSLP